MADQGDKEGSTGLDGRAGRAYQRALEAVFAIPVAAGLGYWADARLETGPVFLLAGLALGCVTFVVLLIRMRSLVGAPDDQERKDE